MTAELGPDRTFARERRRDRLPRRPAQGRGMEPRKGIPGVAMWPDSLSDARPLDTGPAPRRNTEGGIQPADKSLINRRLKRSISLLYADSYIKQRLRSAGSQQVEFVARSAIFLLTTDIRATFRRKIHVFRIEGVGCSSMAAVA